MGIGSLKREHRGQIPVISSSRANVKACVKVVLSLFKGFLSFFKALLMDFYPCVKAFLRDSYPFLLGLFN